ncbi:hypothetical protein [Butyrivibrio sp.]|uniref:hypothetical protein n=1 Tax=Butyrivibrio sp. TaxID=28121 RepID=UPI0025C569BD|nr:hypothetical protein [Butyrivibrio sp.]MBQ7431366.1 hypothetical protein [Butyrivibrio sp.]MBQ9302694.1 hypothetical protein [Butyrivibrio sp.]
MSNIIDLNKRKTAYEEEKESCIRAAQEAEAEMGPNARAAFAKLQQEDLRTSNGATPKYNKLDLIAEFLQADDDIE